MNNRNFFKPVIKYWMIFSFLILCIGNAFSITLYRGDSRTPESVIDKGGMFPIGDLSNTSLYDHTWGEVGHDAFVSTSENRIISRGFVPENGTLFHIASAANMVSVNGALGRHNQFTTQQEYAAMGGIPLGQIMGWIRVSGGVEGPFEENPFYRADIYNEMDVLPLDAGVPMAGFPPGHRAWTEEPWLSNHPDGCSNSRVKRNADNSDQCAAGITNFFKGLISKNNENTTKNPTQLKLKIASVGKEYCIVRNGDYASLGGCDAAPEFRYTRDNQFQMWSGGFAWCLTAPQSVIDGSSGWDYLTFSPCNVGSPSQEFIFNKTSNDGWFIQQKSKSLKITEWKGTLMMNNSSASNGYNFTLVSQTNLKQWAWGTKAHGRPKFLDLRYEMFGATWYPNTIGTGGVTALQTYYDRRTKRISLREGDTFYCLESDVLLGQYHSSVRWNTRCDTTLTPQRWNIELNGKGLYKIYNEEGQYLMVHQNEAVRNPLWMTGDASMYALVPGSGKIGVFILAKNAIND